METPAKCIHQPGFWPEMCGLCARTERMEKKQEASWSPGDGAFPGFLKHCTASYKCQEEKHHGQRLPWGRQGWRSRKVTCTCVCVCDALGTVPWLFGDPCGKWDPESLLPCVNCLLPGSLCGPCSCSFRVVPFTVNKCCHWRAGLSPP